MHFVDMVVLIMWGNRLLSSSHLDEDNGSKIPEPGGHHFSLKYFINYDNGDQTPKRQL